MGSIKMERRRSIKPSKSVSKRSAVTADAAPCDPPVQGLISLALIAPVWLVFSHTLGFDLGSSPP